MNNLSEERRNNVNQAREPLEENLTDS